MLRVLWWRVCHNPISAIGFLGFFPVCQQQTIPGRRIATVAELACTWQELSLLFALEEIKTNGALAIATVPACDMVQDTSLLNTPAMPLRGGNTLCVNRNW